MHQKHAKIARPDIGHWGRSEWAILGSHCRRIQDYVANIKAALPSDYKLAYVDADHAAADQAETRAYELTYTDKINFQQIEVLGALTPIEQRTYFFQQDGVLVNGNHFRANRQIVFLDPQKMPRLAQKLDRLTEVVAFVALDTEGGAEIPLFLKEHCPNWRDIPVFEANDVVAMAQWLLSQTKQTPLKGLILAGGASSRMGEDKAQMSYHGQPQARYLAQLLAELGIEPHFSVKNQPIFTETNWPSIPDTFSDLGPLGAILSAFRHDPNAAWLVLACDLPLMDTATLSQLIGGRQVSKLATSFISPDSPEGFPEPLVAIWEPRAYPMALQFLAQGYTCPRKILINTSIEKIVPRHPAALNNVNTPDAAEKIRIHLKEKNM